MLVAHLDGLKELSIHQKVDQFFYMQKINELKLMQEQAQRNLDDLKLFNDKIQNIYIETYHRWRKDLRWLYCKHSGK